MIRIIFRVVLLALFCLAGGVVGLVIAIWGDGLRAQNEHAAPGFWLGTSAAFLIGAALWAWRR